MPSYTHRDNDYFRLGQCQVCGAPTYHMPLQRMRRSGRTETVWRCEGCQAEHAILEPVENELELFAAYVKARYGLE